jgi:uncharacterized protein with HEPN domain
MPDREPAILIEDIRTAIAKIDRYISGIDLATFLADERIADAVVRNLEIIGEAVKRLPDEFKRLHTEIPWAQISGLRNRIVHHYFGLDLQLIWHLLQNDLKDFEARLTNLQM